MHNWCHGAYNIIGIDYTMCMPKFEKKKKIYTFRVRGGLMIVKYGRCDREKNCAHPCSDIGN